MTINKLIIKKYHLIIIVILILIQIIITTLLTINSELPVVNYLEESYHSKQVVRGHELVKESLLNIKTFWNSIHYQPIYYLISIFFTLVFGKNIFSIIFANNLFFIIALISTYKLSEKLFDKKIALYSTIILAVIPGYFILSKALLLENGLVAILPLSVYFLIMTNRFKNKYYSILLGVSFGIGMLIKVSYIIYFLPILIFYFINKKNYLEIWHNKKNVFLFILIGVLLMLLWYDISFSQIQSQFAITYEESGEKGSLPKIYNLKSLIFYPKIIFFEFLQPILTTLFIISSYMIIKKYDNKYLPLTAIFIPIILFIFIPNKQLRFLLPIAPFFAQIIAFGLKETLKKKFLGILFMGLIILSTINLVLMTYDTGVSHIDKLSANTKNILYYENKPVMFDKNMKNLDLEKLFSELKTYEIKDYLVITYEDIDAYLLDFYSHIYEKNLTLIESCFIFEEVSPDPIKTFNINNFNLLLISNKKNFPSENNLYKKISLDCSRYPEKNNFHEFYYQINNYFSYDKPIIINKRITTHIYKNIKQKHISEI